MTRKLLRLATLTMVVALSAPAAYAEEEPPKLGLNGTVGFSFSDARGNSDNRGVGGNTRLEYITDGPWRHDASFLFVAREENNIRSEERYEGRATSNYYWTEDDYLFGRVDWRKDNFGGVREEWVPGAGYGRVLLRTLKHDLRAEVGAGYRFADLADGTSEEGLALTGGVRYQWQISESAAFFQNALVQWSDDNTFLESETGLRTTIIGSLAVRISYLIRRNSDVPDDRENNDYFTNIGLEYTF